SAAGRADGLAGSGAPVCLTATLLDGLVLARSAFHHSVNYRSVVVLGRAERIDGSSEKLASLELFVEKILPGRWAQCRPPSANELRATTIFRVSLSEASAKIRAGPPSDEPSDRERSTWAGVVPLPPSERCHDHKLVGRAVRARARLGAGGEPSDRRWVPCSRDAW